MKITVTALSKFQRYFPARTSEVEFPGRSISDFISWIKDEYGLDISLHRNVKLTHNTVMVKDFTTPLQEGDRLCFIPLVAGG